MTKWQCQQLLGGVGRCRVVLLVFFFFLICFCHTATSHVKGEYRCTPGWTLFHEERKCVKIMDDAKVTWYDASASCRNLGGDLVRVTSDRKRLFVTNMSPRPEKAPLWIDWQGHVQTGESAPPSTTFQRFYQVLVNYYSYFAQGRPDDVATGKQCVHMHDRQRVVDSCSRKLGYACEMEPSNVVLPAPCPADWILYNNQCLRLYKTWRSWDDARQFCLDQKGHLLDIDSQKKMDFVDAEVLKTDLYVWIGLNDIKTNDSWQWADSNATYNYKDWAPGQPDKRNESMDCITMSPANNSQWYVAFCQFPRPFLCQLKADKVAATNRQENFYCEHGWDWNREYQTCVKGFRMKRTWNEARRVCKQFGADLVVVPDFNYHTYLLDHLTNRQTDHWIGVHHVDSTPVWLDQENQVKYNMFSNWPTTVSGCGFMSTTGHHWGQGDCDQTKNSFICQKNPFGHRDF